MKWIIDRIEEHIVICENEERKMQPFDLSKFEGAPKEGDVVYERNGRMLIDKEETNNRKKVMEQRFKKLLGK